MEQEQFTVKDISTVTGITPSGVFKHIKKFHPEIKLENGKKSFFSKENLNEIVQHPELRKRGVIFRTMSKEEIVSYKNNTLPPVQGTLAPVQGTNINRVNKDMISTKIMKSLFKTTFLPFFKEYQESFMETLKETNISYRESLKDVATSFKESIKEISKENSKSMANLLSVLNTKNISTEEKDKEEKLQINPETSKEAKLQVASENKLKEIQEQINNFVRGKCAFYKLPHWHVWSSLHHTFTVHKKVDPTIFSKNMNAAKKPLSKLDIYAETGLISAFYDYVVKEVDWERLAHPLPVRQINH